MYPSQKNAYGSPPLVEAVFEIFLEDALPTSWNNDSSFSRVPVAFPEMSSHAERLEEYAVQLQVGPDNELSHTMSATPHRLRWWDTQRLRALQFSSHMCAYNVLAGAYARFEDHLDTMQRIFEFFIEEARPRSISWIGQRYLNSIEIPRQEKDVASYFAVYPRLPEEMGQGHIQFALQLQTAMFEQGAVQVRFHPRKPNLEDDTIAYILDVYARSTGDMEPDAGKLLSWQQRAHEHVNKAFELCISNRSRKELFGKE